MEILKYRDQQRGHKLGETLSVVGIRILAESLVGAWELYSGVRGRFDRDFREHEAEQLVGEAFLSGIDSAHDLSVLLMPKTARLDVQNAIRNALMEHEARDL